MTDKDRLKISRLWICQCDWQHITQGPCSCWVCMETLGFAEWQTGKPAPDLPSKLVRYFNPDFRNRIKEDVTKDIGLDDPKSLEYALAKNSVAGDSEGPRAMGWAEEAGLGRHGKTTLWNH